MLVCQCASVQEQELWDGFILYTDTESTRYGLNGHHLAHSVARLLLMAPLDCWRVATTKFGKATFCAMKTDKVSKQETGFNIDQRLMKRNISAVGRNLTCWPLYGAETVG